MTNLINLEQHDGEMRINSRRFSEGVGTSYKATNNLIRKHQKKLETFGELPFQKALKGESSRIKPALLNEDQATFLVTLSRNTETVVEFKHQLVSAFSKLRREQALIDERHATVKWTQNRALGIYQRKDLTAVIQKFITYAEIQGSRGTGFFFINISKAVNKAIGIVNRDEISEDKLSTLAFAEIVVEVTLLEGMRDLVPYKQIYSAMKARLSTISELLPEAVEAYAAERKTPALEGSRGILNIANNGGFQ